MPSVRGGDETLGASTDPGPAQWSGGGLDLEVTTIAQPIVAAFPDVAEDWPDYPEVIAAPLNGLFLVDGDHAALLLDAGTTR